MFEEAPRPSGRRSKLEITCDILGVISKGAEKPTRIMQLANVTWDDLIMYLEALIRNQLLSRQVDGKRVTYSLTERGSALLDHYLELKREAAPLRLETLTQERISRALTYLPRIGSQESEVLAKLETRLKGDGFKILSPKIVGKSGVVHTLGIVAQGRDGAKHGYVVIRTADEAQMMKLFVTQLDTDLAVHALYSGELPSKVAELARAYSLDLQPWEEAEANGSSLVGGLASQVDVKRFEGKSVLLEVDPATAYEVVVREFAERFRSSNTLVFAFTRRGGPIHAALSPVDGVQIFGTTSHATHSKPSGEEGKTTVTQDDLAVLLDFTANAIQGHPDRRVLLIFDGISDIFSSLGFEKSYGFLKAQNELVAKGPNATLLVVAKRNARDARAMNLIRGLYPGNLSFDASGLAVTRAV